MTACSTRSAGWPRRLGAGLGRWLLGERRGGRRRVRYGDRVFVCDAQHHLPAILAALPDFGRNLADVVLCLGRDAPRVIDIGANIGDTALLLARFASGAHLLCIEGDPRFLGDLEENTHGLPGVQIVRAVLSDCTGDAPAAFVPTAGTSRLVVGGSGERIRTETLDDLIARYPDFGRPDVLKIDTDGGEPAILRGARRLIAAARPVLFYEWDPHSYAAAGESDLGHARYLMDLGYSTFLFFTNRGEPLLWTDRPAERLLEGLAHFSRSRHGVDGWHYDVAVFADEQRAAAERLWRCCMTGREGRAAPGSETAEQSPAQCGAAPARARA